MKQKWQLAGLALFLGLILALSFTWGKYPLSLDDLGKIILNQFFPLEPTWEAAAENIIWQIRLPRILGAILIGAALAVAGAAYQGIFRNPMVSPDILGASSGAGLGAALAIWFYGSHAEITALAFVGAIGAVLAAYWLGRLFKDNFILGLILAGIMLGNLFSSATSLIKIVADTEDQLPAITYWLLGSLTSLRMNDLAWVSGPILLGLIPLWAMRWKLNLLTVGEEEAQSMGINTKAIRLTVIICATLLTAASVSVSGLIGWVGLVIPHFCRLFLGYDYRYLIPGSALLGAVYLLAMDDLARLLTTAEIPLGILTSFVGVPVFLYLIAFSRKKEL